MNSKLQILIPQYNETEEIIKPLLDSIQMQQNIDIKNDFEVFIGNDGSDTKLSVDFLKTYSFKIQYHFFEHEGLAATRQKLFNLSTADYIIYCDADDKFINTIAFSIILNDIQSKSDMLIYDFLAEKHINGNTIYIPYTNDCIFVHGKVYRRQYLLDNEIIWHKELHEHQDSPFNILARLCTKNQRICNIPLYLWVDNQNSISRKNGEMHRPMTYHHMIDSLDYLVMDLQSRNIGNSAAYYAKYCLYLTYYETNTPIWNTEEAQKYKGITYKRIYNFYKKYHLLIKTVNEKVTEPLIKQAKEMVEKRDTIENLPPFEEWLNSIIALFKDKEGG